MSGHLAPSCCSSCPISLKASPSTSGPCPHTGPQLGAIGSYVILSFHQIRNCKHYSLRSRFQESFNCVHFPLFGGKSISGLLSAAFETGVFRKLRLSILSFLPHCTIIVQCTYCSKCSHCVQCPFCSYWHNVLYLVFHIMPTLPTLTLHTITLLLHHTVHTAHTRVVSYPTR